MAHQQTGRSRGTAHAAAWGVLAVFGTLLAAAAATAATGAPARAHAAGTAPAGNVPATLPSAPARAWAHRVLHSSDHGGMPFVVVDKHAAQVVLHRSDGSIVASSPALLGFQPGDHSVPGVGQRTQAGTLQPRDMTTPAGRFVARPGVNRTGEMVLWLDEDAALALHRLRPGKHHAVRHRALARAEPAARRLSAGCVVVPAEFFDSVVMPLFGSRGGVVYVLPEHSAWPSLRLALHQSSG